MSLTDYTFFENCGNENSPTKQFEKVSFRIKSPAVKHDQLTPSIPIYFVCVCVIL